MFRTRYLGIDVGTSAVKLVELSGWRGRRKLENYGEIETEAFYEKPFRTFKRGTFLLSVEDIAKAIKAIKREAGIKTKKVNFAIPDFSTFFTSFELPPMSEDELPQAVRFEASQHVPLPLSELALDWSLIEGRLSKTRLKILLVAIPERVVDQYKEVAARCGLELDSLEAEVFSFTRALSERQKKKVVALVDIGAQTTTISMIDSGTLKVSHSFDISGNELTHNLSKSLRIDLDEAEELKKKYGLREEGRAVKKILEPRINLIISEVGKIGTRFKQGEGKEMEEVVLGGGTATMPGLKEHFNEELKCPVKIADPFSDIYCPSILESELKKAGPSFGVAIGLALRGLEE